MPRTARVKAGDCIYHIIVRSVSDTPLFRCSYDKERYLHIIKKYQYTYLFKIYAFCLMDTHAHIIIDACGADISKIMHCINQSYAQYFNIKYNRHGHLFADRFKSKIIAEDKNLFNASAYINKNSKDIRGYRGREERYRYSSYGIYAGKREDDLELVDIWFILNQFSSDPIDARRQYVDFVRKYDEYKENEDGELKNEKTQYRSERKIIVREYTPDEVVEFVAHYIKGDKWSINIKHKKGNSHLRALCALIMRGICDMKQREICAILGNITQSQVSRLCSIGFKLIRERDEYKNIIRDFIAREAA